MKKNNMPPMKRIKDQKYYMENVDIEAEIMKKAIELAEKMVAATMREYKRNDKVKIDIDIEDLAERIARKIKVTGVLPAVGASLERATDEFSFNDTEVVVATENYEVTGNIKKTSKTKETTDNALEALMDLDI